MIPKDRREKRLPGPAEAEGRRGRERATSNKKPRDGAVDPKKPPADATLDLKPADFELLAAEKRTGGATLAPLRARMIAWARRIVTRLSELGIDATATWSDEEPIFLGPGTASIVFHAPVRKNAILALRLRAKVVEVSVEIYPSVHARAVADDIARLFDALPEQFSLGKIEDDRRVPAGSAHADDVRALFEGDGGLWLGWSVPRDLVLKHAALVGEQLGDAVIALSQVFALVTEIAVGPESFTRSLGGRNRKRAVLSVSSAGSSRARDPLEKGARVRVLSGPFVGKTGVVQELDGRGVAKVMLGLLATRLEIRDLARATEGEGRPILSSSHRKPLGAR